jgi:preprotein translocase subunit SecY
MIIMAGIIAVMPSMFGTAFTTLMAEGTWGIIKFILFIVFYIGIIIALVYEQSSERRIPIQYANKTASAYGAQQSYIPFKLNSSGVLPVIFASSLIAIPSFIAAFIKKEAFSDFVNKWVVDTSPTGFVVYMLLIIAFTYFYTYAQLKPKELAENLQKSGGFIPGIRPGDETEKYIKKVLSRTTVVGALALAFIAALPIVFAAITNLPSNVRIGGTGVLIVVGVALESYKQLESYIVSRSYKKGRR